MIVLLNTGTDRHYRLNIGWLGSPRDSRYASRSSTSFSFRASRVSPA